MSKLNMYDMNSLNSIAGHLNHSGQYRMAGVLDSIQIRATEMIDEQASIVLCKTVNVTNPKNVLVQVPSMIAGLQWGLKQGDKLEVMYNEKTKEITIKPVLLGRGRPTESC